MRDTFREQREGICQRVGEARRAACLTHEGLAQNLSACAGTEVTVRQVRRYEKSRVPWALLDDLARLTGTTREWLLYGDGEARAGDAPERLWEDRPPGRADPWEEPTPRLVRPGLSAARILLGIGLGFLLAVVVQRLTHSTPTAMVTLLAVFAIALLRRGSG